MAHQVFLSYATEDADTASRVCEMLEADGTGCWLPSRDATASEDRAAEVLEAIRSSELVLLVFSASANASPTVLRDIERAIAYERPVLSIHLDETVPNPSLEYYLNLWQWLEASEGVEGKRDDIGAAVRGQLAGTPESAEWLWLDAPGGVESKREEIVAAVWGLLDQISSSAPSQEADGSATSGRRRPSRRTWAIGVAAGLASIALGLGLGLGLTGTSHQGAWTRLEPEGTVPPACGGIGALVYDSSTGRVIMFGGSDPDDPFFLKCPPRNDTWAYDPAANVWSELKPLGTVPPPRAGPAMAYDPTTGLMVMFGGCDRPAIWNADWGWLYHTTADTWAYDPAANSWTELKPSGTIPPARSGATMTYDPTTRWLIMFGGGVDSAGAFERGLGLDSGNLNDTWAYDPTANKWTELEPAGVLPPRRSMAGMVNDPSTGRMIMFGGVTDSGHLNDTWAYDPSGNTWTNLNPSGTLPKTGFGSGMAYDLSSGSVVIYGGSNLDGSSYVGDTWAYDPVANNWTELKPSGALPGARFAPSLVYAPSVGQVFMFGGVSAGIKVGLNDIWVFAP